MPLKVGSLYVSLSANTSGLVKGFAEAAKATEKIAKEVKKTANDVAGAAAIFAGLGAAAMKMAASVDGPAKKSMDGLEKSMQLVAVQVADIIRPAVDSLSKSFRELAGYIAGIDPETKKSIATFATWAAGIAVAAKGISVVSGLVSTLSGALSGIAGVVAALGTGPILAIVAAVAMVAAGIAALHYVWRNNIGGMADATQKFVNWLGEAFNSAFEGVITLVDGVVRALMIQGLKIYKMMALYYDLMGDATKATQYGFAAKSIELDLKLSKPGQLGKAMFVQGLELGKIVGEAFVDEWERIISKTGINKFFTLPQQAAPRAPTATPEQLPTVGTMDTSSLGVMQFYSQMEKAASDGASAVGEVAQQFSNAQGDAVSAAAYQQAIADAAAQAAAAAEQEAKKRKAIVGIITQGTGALGGAIQNIAQGAKAGPWGAIIAAVLEVFQRMASWKGLMDIFEKGLQRLGEFMEPLMSGLFDTVGVFTQLGTEILKPLFDAFKPLMDTVNRTARQFIPVFEMLGQVFEALGPLISMAIRFGEQFALLQPLTDLIRDVFKAVTIALLTLMYGVNSIMAALGDQGAAAEASRIQKALQGLWTGIEEHGSVPAAVLDATASGTEALNDLADSADRVSESLSNVPSGYKVALARYQADWGASPGMLAAAGGGGTTVIINGDITTDASSVAELADDAIAEAKRNAGQRWGNPFSRGGSP